MATPERFTATVKGDARGRALIQLPFDPDAAWGSKHQHHVRGTVDGNKVRGPLRLTSAGWTWGYLRWIDGASRRPEIRAGRLPHPRRGSR